ncbi:Glycosyl Hydrolase Family 88 [Paenibacillus sp. UNC496MF]|uniref:glycoside hydrolase family 88 protein n=1 Tax=Paenibacillus sp. UNC496MF TaxID=1502753 RepID=UPI0008E87E36|nr:glycoside hydrolase family 88 protein [Paenibacillus sp. UNC496MF]SFJ81348.1 Glycosyl Hydrolase Family 88 [Paenibacillus sp. UNC496MF]
MTEQASFAERIWADTVFMAVLFLARTARMAGDPRLAEEALEQTLLHLRALQDDETGLLYHGWNCASGTGCPRRNGTGRTRGTPSACR